jgi:hypothetical protein
MSETINTSYAANLISENIFSTFKWELHELHDQNLECEFKEHKKKTHPCDCVFHYVDPYTGKTLYFNTDLKSYAKKSITSSTIKTALDSLAMSIHCAGVSESWQKAYLNQSSDLDHEIRGFLFVYNHDNNYSNDFHEQFSEINLTTFPIAKGNFIHFMGPKQIEDCYSIACDINICIGKMKIEKYTFWYPDMMMHKVKHGEYWEQPATIEQLSSPILITKYEKNDGKKGYLIYYKRAGNEIDEFVYLIDMLSHYQILSEELQITLKFIGQDRDSNIMANFKNAKLKYMQIWNMDEVRENQLNLIVPERVTRHSEHYNIGELGWSEK